MNTVDFDQPGERGCSATAGLDPQQGVAHRASAKIYLPQFTGGSCVSGNYHRDMFATSSPSIVLSFEEARGVVEAHAAEIRAACFPDAHRPPPAVVVAIKFVAELHLRWVRET